MKTGFNFGFVLLSMGLVAPSISKAALIESPRIEKTVAIVIGRCSDSTYPGNFLKTDGSRQIEGVLGLGAGAATCKTVIGLDHLPALGSVVSLETGVRTFANFPRYRAPMRAPLAKGSVVRILSYAGTFQSNAFIEIFSMEGDMYAVVEILDSKSDLK